MKDFNLALPSLDATLSADVCVPDQRVLKNLKNRLEPLIQGTGSLSKASALRRDVIQKHLLNGGSLTDLKPKPRDIRFLTSLFREDDDVLDAVTFDRTLIRLIDRVASPLTASLLRQLTVLVFERYDRIDGHELLASYLYDQYGSSASRLARFRDLAIYQKNRFALFVTGPEALVQLTTDRDDSLQQVADAWCVPRGPRAEYFRRATLLHYLETLRQLPLTRGHRVMDEILKGDVRDTPMADGRLLGHDAVAIMINRVLKEKAALSDTWRDFILAVCGDPRVPKSSRPFTKWWGRFEPAQVKAMRRWLSKLDLRLFLKVLEQIADTSGDTDMKRMFPARRKFLEGLFDQDLIHHSRLILSAEAERRLKKTFSREDLPEYARVKNGNTCMIYLDLGSAHLVEGTHSVPLRRAGVRRSEDTRVGRLRLARIQSRSDHFSQSFHEGHPF